MGISGYRRDYLQVIVHIVLEILVKEYLYEDTERCLAYLVIDERQRRSSTWMCKSHRKYKDGYWHSLNWTVNTRYKVV